MTWSFDFDVRTALLTAVAIPLISYLAKLFVKHARDWLAYCVEGLLYEATAAVKHPVAARLSLARYARLQLASTTRFLPVPSSQDLKLDVDTTFVPLTLENAAGQASQKYLNSDVLPTRTRIIGDPGSGKSSLLKKMLREASQEALRNPRRARLPILLELRHLRPPAGAAPEALGEWILGVLREAVARNQVYNASAMFDLYARAPGLLVLFDGLDEVSALDYAGVETAIVGLSGRLSELGPNNAIVVTMRYQFHLQVRHAYDSSYPTVMKIQSFSPSDIYDFLTRWPFAATTRGHGIARVYEELTTRPTLRDMCRNPLVLSMYVAEHESSDEFIPPESRTEFYQRVTNELLIRRRLQQTGSKPGHSTLRDQRQRILGRLALDHLLDPHQPANSLEWTHAMRVVKEVTHCTDEEAPALFRNLSKETGLISEERTGERLRFIHLTFCEFFAAWEAVRGETDRWEQLLQRYKTYSTSQERAQRTRLLEVIPFAAALRLPREAQRNAVTQLAQLGDLRLLARTFLEAKLYDHPAWSPFIDSQRAILLEAPESKWDDEWLRDLHLFNVLVRDAEAAASHVQQPFPADLDGFFRMLLKRQMASLERVLAAYAIQDAAAAFYLCEVSEVDLATRFPHLVIRSCDQPPFFGLVLEKAAQDPTSLWLKLLSESALTSAVVAQWLTEVRTPSTWSNAIGGLPNSRRWYALGVVTRTPLTECLTIADVEPNRSTATATPLLNALNAFPSPPSVRVLRGLSIGLTVVPICLLVAAQFAPDLDAGQPIAFGRMSPRLLATLLGALLVGWFAGRYFEGYRVLYAAVLNAPASAMPSIGWIWTFVWTLSKPWSWMSKPGPYAVWRASQFFVGRAPSPVSLVGPLLPARVWRLGHDFILRRERVALGK